MEMQVRLAAMPCMFQTLSWVHVDALWMADWRAMGTTAKPSLTPSDGLVVHRFSCFNAKMVTKELGS